MAIARWYSPVKGGTADVVGIVASRVVRHRFTGRHSCWEWRMASHEDRAGVFLRFIYSRPWKRCRNCSVSSAAIGKPPV